MKRKKCWRHLLYVMSLVSLQQENVKKSEKMIKIVNIEEENAHIFRKTWGISRKFSEEMWLMMILKVTKNQDFNLSLKNAILEKQLGGSNWTPSFFMVDILMDESHSISTYHFIAMGFKKSIRWWLVINNVITSIVN